MSGRRINFPSLPRSGPLFDGPIYPGNGYPPRPDEDRPALSPFGRLAYGQTIGKSSILVYNALSPEVQPSPVDMLTVNGDDLDAWQMVVTLHPPRVVALPFEAVTARLDQQNVTGEMTNAEITTGNFPGTDRPIRWPPLEALIEWGTGGVNTTVTVDYVNGVTFSVIASYLRVNALVAQNQRDGGVFGTSAAYHLSAHVGPGFAVPHVQRTIFVGGVGAGLESDVLDVPKFSKFATVTGARESSNQPPVPLTGWIRFWQSPDATGGLGDFFISGSDHRPVEIPNAAQYFTVLNSSGAALKMNVVFELSL